MHGTSNQFLPGSAGVVITKAPLTKYNNQTKHDRWIIFFQKGIIFFPKTLEKIERILFIFFFVYYKYKILIIGYLPVLFNEHNVSWRRSYKGNLGIWTKKILESFHPYLLVDTSLCYLFPVGTVFFLSLMVDTKPFDTKL